MSLPNTLPSNALLEVVSRRPLIQEALIQEGTAPARARSHSKPSLPSRIAVIGNYLPRHCGIATFTTDLRRAIATEYGTARLLALPVNDTDDVVFPCGYTMDADGDTLNIYYGAADCAIALARSSVRSLLDWPDANGSCERRQRTQDL